MNGEEVDDLLLRLRKERAPHDDDVAALAGARLEQMLDDEQLHLAAMHAVAYEAYWNDGRRLDTIRRFHRLGMTAQAITLCHRWKMSAYCDDNDHRLYRELFPKLPPRTDKKERP